MKFLINQREIKLTWTNAVYFIVIIFFVLYTGLDLAYNTAFVDEAIYATVGEEVLRGIYWENALSWMGGTYLYPVLSAYLNHLWGLQGIRLVAIIFVLATGIIAGKIGKILGGKKVEALTIALFLFSATSLDLAQLGTYDAPSLAFGALSLWNAILSRSRYGTGRMINIIISALFLTLAVFTKYFAIIFLPIVGLLVILKGRKIKFDAGFAWSAIVFLILGIFIYLYGDVVILYFKNQNASEPAERIKIINEVLRHIILFIVGAVAASIMALKAKPERRQFIFILAIGGLFPLIYHIGAANIRSLWKHVVISAFFWAPLTSWALYKTWKFVKSSEQKTSILSNLAQMTFTLTSIAFITGLWMSLSAHWRFQRSWPSATSTINYLAEHRQPDDIIFGEASTVYKFHLFSGFDNPASWSSTWYFEYQGEFGTEAMKKAIADKVFDYVILNNYFTSYVNQELAANLEIYYEKVLEDPYKVQGVYNYTTTIWKPKEESLPTDSNTEMPTRPQP